MNSEDWIPDESDQRRKKCAGHSRGSFSGAAKAKDTMSMEG